MNNSDYGLLRKSRMAVGIAVASAILVACEGDDGDDGMDGAPGADGLTSLINQVPVEAGDDCANGGARVDSGIDDNGNGVLDEDEVDATEFVCNGEDGATSGPDPLLTPIATDPLSSMVAVTLNAGTGYESIPAYTKALVQDYVEGGNPLGGAFPLAAPADNTNDFIAVIGGLAQNVVVRWFDAITPDRSVDAPRFGANNDYLAYFGDGWNDDWNGDQLGSSPYFNGSSDAAWIWSNHEYISDDEPLALAAPEGQYLSLAKFLANAGVIDIDDPSNDSAWTQSLVDTHVDWEKKQHGGSWLRVERQADGRWEMVPHAAALRYDSSDSTLARITGYELSEQDTDDTGAVLPNDVVVGITADCSGGTSPWGTVFTAEENAQSQWGDFEAQWTNGSRQFVIDGDGGFSAGANISPNPAASETSEFGRHSDPATRHNRDAYGFLVEIDVGEAPEKFYESVNDGGDGSGHRKIGAMGRARWENMDFVTDANLQLVPNQPIVMYGANDRRAGRIYKWVSAGNYTESMTRGEVRALLDEGRLYVSHWEDLDALTGLTRYDPQDPNWAACSGDAVLNDKYVNNINPNGERPTLNDVIDNCPQFTEAAPGQGTWIELSVSNDAQVAPNAAANGDGTETVGAALRDVNWNNIGGFPSDNDVLSALFTASAKLGVRELNRPEDVEWNPVDQSLYIAFTYHGEEVGQLQDGTLVMRNLNGDAVATDGTVLPEGLAIPERGIVNVHDFERADNFGTIFRLVEANGANPGASMTFSYYPVFYGVQGDDAFAIARPDNLSIDQDGGVWFGTDGNTSSSSNNAVDGIAYLDLNPAHKEGQPGVVNPSYGKAFRILHGSSNGETTGPAWNANQDTIFYNNQHPGEGSQRDSSAWPSSQSGI